MPAPEGLELTQLRQLTAALRQLGVPDDAVKDAMAEAGAIVQREAFRIMPFSSGRMARTLKVNRARNLLKISVGSKAVPYAYTFHATALGATFGGRPAFTFHVPAHSQRDRWGNRTTYRAYTRQAYIPNRPFLFTAFKRKEAEVFRAYVTAMGQLFSDALGKVGR